MSWTDRWIGLPYAKGGRGPAFDCLGLVIAVQADQFGRAVHDPRGGVAALRRIGRELRACWTRIDGAAVAGDVAVFRTHGHILHVGTMLDARRMLHIEDQLGSRIERIDRMQWRPRLEGVYRHAG